MSNRPTASITCPIGKKIAYKANRAGVADGFPTRRPKSMEVDLALIAPTTVCSPSLSWIW